MIVDHHAGHPHRVPDDLQAEADEHEADDLSDLALGQDGEKQTMDPVALRLLGEHAVDEHREGPGLKKSDRDGDPDQHHETGDPAPVGCKVGHRASVDGH